MNYLLYFSYIILLINLIIIYVILFKKHNKKYFLPLIMIFYIINAALLTIYYLNNIYIYTKNEFIYKINICLSILLLLYFMYEIFTIHMYNSKKK